MQQKMTNRSVLPLGFAEQVLDLQAHMQEQQSLQLIQILGQMYRIAVQYYINNDLKKANYFQNKLNILAIKSLNAQSIETTQSPKKSMHEIEVQMNRWSQCQKVYVQHFMEHQAKSQDKCKKIIHQNIQRQEDQLQDRKKLRKVRSSQKL